MDNPIHPITKAVYRYFYIENNPIRLLFNLNNVINFFLIFTS